MTSIGGIPGRQITIGMVEAVTIVEDALDRDCLVDSDGDDAVGSHLLQAPPLGIQALDSQSDSILSHVKHFHVAGSKAMLPIVPTSWMDTLERLVPDVLAYTAGFGFLHDSFTFIVRSAM
eukprot:1934742-Amphidinium_carterae.1